MNTLVCCWCLMLNLLIVAGGQDAAGESDEIVRLLNEAFQVSLETPDSRQSARLVADIKLMVKLGYFDQAIELIKRARPNLEDRITVSMVTAVAVGYTRRKEIDNALAVIHEFNDLPEPSKAGVTSWNDRVVNSCLIVCIRNNRIDEAIRFAGQLDGDASDLTPARKNAWREIVYRCAINGNPQRGRELAEEALGQIPGTIGNRLLEASINKGQFDWFLENLSELATDENRMSTAAIVKATTGAVMAKPNWRKALHQAGNFEFVLRLMETRFEPASEEMKDALKSIARCCDSAEVLNRACELAPDLARQSELAFQIASGYARAGEMQTAIEMAANAARDFDKEYRGDCHFESLNLAKGLLAMKQQGAGTAARSLLTELSPDWLRTLVKFRLAELMMYAGDDDGAQDLVEELAADFNQLKGENAFMAFLAYPVLARYGFEEQAREYLDPKLLFFATPVARHLIKNGKIDECKDLLDDVEQFDTPFGLTLVMEIATAIDVDTAVNLSRRILAENQPAVNVPDDAIMPFLELIRESEKQGQLEFARKLHELISERAAKAPGGSQAMVNNLQKDMSGKPWSMKQLTDLQDIFEHDQLVTKLVLEQMAFRGETTALLQTLENAMQDAEQQDQWHPDVVLSIYRCLVEAGEFEGLELKVSNYKVPGFRENRNELRAIHLAMQEDFAAAVELAESVNSPATRRLLFRRCAEGMYHRANPTSSEGN